METVHKVVFDVECMKHQFVLSYRRLNGYKEDGIPHSVHTPKDAYNAMKENADALWIGYNSNDYDDYIMSAILESEGEVTAEDLAELSSAIIETTNRKPRKCFTSYDCFDPINVGMRSLKMFCGSSGRSTYDSPYSFKEDRYYNDKEVREIERYCEEDVEYTTEVFLNEKGFFEASLSRLDIISDAGYDIPPEQEIQLVCCKGASFSRRLFEMLCGTRDSSDNCRTGFWLIHDFSNPRYDLGDDAKELKEACKFYSDIIEGQDEYSDEREFYDKDATPDFPDFTPECGINLGWGGAHGAINGYTFSKELMPDKCVLYVDVSSMYPTLLVQHDLFPHTFTQDAKEMYAFAYRSRLEYKKNGETYKCDASKLIINSLTGLLKDRFAKFRAEWSNNAIVVNGQIAILRMATLLRRYGFRIVQVNTDGIMVECEDTGYNRKVFEDLRKSWCDEYKFEAKTKEVDVLVQTNVNNYYMKLIGSDEEVRKGAAYNFNTRYFKDDVIVKELLPFAILQQRSAHDMIEEAIRTRDIMDFVVLIKVTDTFPWLWEIISDTYSEARCVRCLAAKCTPETMRLARDNSIDFVDYVKVRRNDGTDAGTKVSNFPETAIELPADISFYDANVLRQLIDIDYYANRLAQAIKIFYADTQSEVPACFHEEIGYGKKVSKRAKKSDKR